MEPQTQDQQTTDTQPQPQSRQELVRRSVEELTGYDMQVNEDGDTEFVVTSEPHQPQEELVQELAEVRGDGPPETAAEDPWEKRYKDVQAWATRVNQKNLEIEKKLENVTGQLEGMKRVGAEGDEDKEPLDLNELWSDPNRGIQFIGSLVNEIVGPAMRDMNTKLSVLQAQKDASDEVMQAHQKYGQDFVKSWPQIQKIMDAYPDSSLTLTQAYELLQEFRGESGSEQNGVAGPPEPSGTPQPAPTAPQAVRRIPADEARAAAARNSSEERLEVAGDPNAEPDETASTPREAAMMALRQMAQGRL